MASSSYDIQEQYELMEIFQELLWKVTRDGGIKREAGSKPPWYLDPSHERGLFSHLAAWKAGVEVDSESGTHPLVHLAWRALAIAYQEIEEQQGKDFNGRTGGLLDGGGWAEDSLPEAESYTAYETEQESGPDTWSPIGSDIADADLARPYGEGEPSRGHPESSSQPDRRKGERRKCDCRVCRTGGRRSTDEERVWVGRDYPYPPKSRQSESDRDWCC